MTEPDIHRGTLSTEPIDVTIGGETQRLEGGWTYLGYAVRFDANPASRRTVEPGRGRRSRFDRRRAE